MRPALVLAILAAPSVAHADAGVSAASVGVGGGTFTEPGPKDTTIGPTLGGLLLATYERGFSESFSWRVEASGGFYGGGGGLSWSGAASAGLVYRFDVLKYVPYATVELGGVAVGGVVPTTLDPVVEIGAGLDWLTARDRSWGLEARVAGFVGDTTTYSLALRKTFRWGFF